MIMFFCFFKQKTAYEMRISDWSSDVCSSDLGHIDDRRHRRAREEIAQRLQLAHQPGERADRTALHVEPDRHQPLEHRSADIVIDIRTRSEEHTSELQSLMRISYAVFCLKKKKHKFTTIQTPKLTSQLIS